MNLPSLDVNPSWLSPEVIQTLGWTLIHFLWEGLALALCFQLLANFCGSARARYTLAFATLVAMAAAPVLTYVALGAANSAGAANGYQAMAADISRDAAQAMSDFAYSPAASPWLNWLVVLWFLGVALLSLRVAGGWYVADSLRRRDVTPLAPALRARFERLRTQLGISRPVQFLQSAIVNAPAVVGWLRPVVLIPMSAVVGLTPAQLEAVIIHELAHIRRLDALANLLQMAVETALFYHPAVWWISRRIRIEREHCCDDVAVSLSGDALGFAKALASLEEWRALPMPVLAANGGVLKHRISRLLGLNIRTGNVSVMGAAGVGLVCLVGCVVAHGADVDATTAATLPAPAPFPGLELVANVPAPPIALTPPAPPRPARPEILAAPVEIPIPAIEDIRIRVPGRDLYASDRDDENAAERARELRRELAQEQADLAREQADDARAQVREAREHLREESLEHMRSLEVGLSRHPTKKPAPEDASYVAALDAAGLKNLDSDDVLQLKTMGVTAEYVREIAAAGYTPRVRYLLAFKAQGIDPAYIKEVRGSGLDVSASQLLGFRAQGVNAAFIRDVHAVWADAGAAQITALHVRGVTPEYIKSVRASWPDVSVNDLIAMRTLGVSAADAAAFRKSGAPDLSIKQLVSFRALGVTPEFVTALKAAGIKDLSAKDYAAAKVRGITPEFLNAVRKHGFSNLSMRQLIALKDAEVL